MQSAGIEERVSGGEEEERGGGHVRLLERVLLDGCDAGVLDRRGVVLEANLEHLIQRRVRVPLDRQAWIVVIVRYLLCNTYGRCHSMVKPGSLSLCVIYHLWTVPLDGQAWIVAKRRQYEASPMRGVAYSGDDMTDHWPRDQHESIDA